MPDTRRDLLVWIFAFFALPWVAWLITSEENQSFWLWLVLATVILLWHHR